MNLDPISEEGMGFCFIHFREVMEMKKLLMVNSILSKIKGKYNTLIWKMTGTTMSEEKFNELYRKHMIPKELSEALKEDRPDLSRIRKFITVIVPMVVIGTIVWLLTKNWISTFLGGLFFGWFIGLIAINIRRDELAREKAIENKKEPQERIPGG
jgi:hypothetical protein